MCIISYHSGTVPKISSQAAAARYDEEALLVEGELHARRKRGGGCSSLA